MIAPVRRPPASSLHPMPAQKPSRSKPPTKSQMVRATWSCSINCSTSTARQHICSRLILRIKGSLMLRAYPLFLRCQLTCWVVFSQLQKEVVLSCCAEPGGLAHAFPSRLRAAPRFVVFKGLVGITDPREPAHPQPDEFRGYHPCQRRKATATAGSRT